MKPQKILVVGGTGYVGTRLVQLLLENGLQVRVTYRSIEKIQTKLWFKHPNLQIIWADAFHKKSMIDACKDCYTVYYLIHCMFPDQDDYQISDKTAANNMVEAAQRSSIKNIIYLSGLGGKSTQSSRHLKSRYQVGQILKSGSIPVTIFNSGMIIGSGSASFEILRYIVERLPIMITPKWVDTKSQPIAIGNVIKYLYDALNNSEVIGETFDIGGPDIVTYRQLMEIYAKEASLSKRLVISLPVNDPFQSSAFFLRKIIPLDISIIKPLIGSLRIETVCSENKIQNIIFQPLFSIKESIRRAIMELKRVLLHDSFQFEGWTPPMEWSYFGDPVWSGGSILFDRWTAVLNGNIDHVWKTIEGIGGINGWYHGNWLWKIRGFIDELLGGHGLKRGRKDSQKLSRGDVLDCWRVTQIRPRAMILLTAELKLPGIGSLCFKLKKIGNGKIILDQIASYVPRGLWGILYWRIVLPFHSYIFKGMIKKIAKISNCKIVYGPKYLTRSIQV